MIVDYIIVGAGLAGCSFAEIALQHQKKILVFENYSQPSSTVAGGLINPIILKRFTEAWNVAEQHEFSIPFFKELEQKLHTNFVFELPIYRKIASVEEQNNWFTASDKPNLQAFLNPKMHHTKFKYINSDFGFGEVLQTGYMDSKLFLEKYHQYLSSKELIEYTTFDYESLKIEENYIEYKGSKAKNIIFSEGFGLHKNSFFNNLPLDGTKGELLIIEARELPQEIIFKSNVFIMPVGNHLFKVGATYNWDDKTNKPTAEAKNELIEKLNELISCDYKIIEHLAGVRPTVKDRRPLVGTHPTYSNIHILNGLGTRGVYLAPYLANHLYENLEKNKPLLNDININRLKKIIWK